MNTTSRAPRTRRRRSALIAALVFLLAAAVPPVSSLVSGGVVGAQAGQATTPEGAVRGVVELGGDVYAGECSDTVSPRDIGKVCSKVVGEQGGLRAYLVGRTFSEFSSWVFIRRERDGWRPAGTAPLDFFAPSLDIPWPR